MPNARERSCSEKEVQAIRFNHNEQRCLQKKIISLKQEGACSIQLINQTNKHIKVSYNNLKDKVAKIKTNLNVKEINEFRKLEDEGKIELFKSILKPDSEARISSYAKRLQIDYGDTKPVRQNDEIGTCNMFDDTDETRKDILLRQISELNDRFIATQEKEKAMEKGVLQCTKMTDSKKTHKVLSSVDDNNDVEQINIKEVSKNKKRKEFIPRPNTAFEFTNKNYIIDENRPATSMSNCPPTRYDNIDKTVGLVSGQIKVDKQAKLKRSKSLKFGGTKSTPVVSLTNEPFFKTDNQARPCSETKAESDLQEEKPTAANTKQKSIPSKNKVVTRSTSVKQSLKSEECHKVLGTNKTDSKSTIKRRHTEKMERPKTSIFKPKSSKVRPTTAVTPTSDRTQSRAMSALSAKGSPAIKNIIACMSGSQKAPFDCHSNAEREEKDSKEEGRTSFLSRDSIESNLGHDLHRELRKELLQEEEINAIKIEDKICNFMDRLNISLKSEKAEEPLLLTKKVISTDDIMKRPVDPPKIVRRVNERRLNKFSDEERRKMEVLRFRRSSDAWKDVNKCRYLRIEESKIDLSGIKTLAVDQLSLLGNMRYSEVV